jgi:hypothetical protein
VSRVFRSLARSAAVRCEATCQCAARGIGVQRACAGASTYRTHHTRTRPWPRTRSSPLCANNRTDQYAKAGRLGGGSAARRSNMGGARGARTYRRWSLGRAGGARVRRAGQRPEGAASAAHQSTCAPGVGSLKPPITLPVVCLRQLSGQGCCPLGCCWGSLRFNCGDAAGFEALKGSSAPTLYAKLMDQMASKGTPG